MKHLILIAVLLCGLTTGAPEGAAAGSFPALYDVAGVASDDVLNIRTRPSPSSDIIGALIHIQKGVEVMRLDPSGRWGLVNAGEGSGWVSMRYLALQPGQGGAPLARPLYCSGTEPFWDARISARNDMQFNMMGEPSVALTEGANTTAAGRRDKYATVWNAPGTAIVGVMTRARCSDGMSDREFAIAVDFLLFGASGPRSMYSGCCSLSGN